MQPSPLPPPPRPPTERFFRIFLDSSKGFKNPKSLLSVDVHLFLLIIISNFGDSDCYDYHDSGIYELSLWNEICKWVSHKFVDRDRLAPKSPDMKTTRRRCCRKVFRATSGRVGRVFTHVPSWENSGNEVVTLRKREHSLSILSVL